MPEEHTDKRGGGRCSQQPPGGEGRGSEKSEQFQGKDGNQTPVKWLAANPGRDRQLEGPCRGGRNLLSPTTGGTKNNIMEQRRIDHIHSAGEMECKKRVSVRSANMQWKGDG